MKIEWVRYGEPVTIEEFAAHNGLVRRLLPGARLVYDEHDGCYYVEWARLLPAADDFPIWSARPHPPQES